VLAVVINHLQASALPGGYLGVDIFFVISGYVVTASLVGRKENDGLAFLRHFYQRRFRRLLPALVLTVLLVALLFSMVASSADDSHDPSLRTGLAALFGLSNLYLLRQGNDYFAASTQFNPFTHTWSLGVEEQYYLLWPIILLACGLGRSHHHHAFRRLAVVSLLITAISFGFWLHLRGHGRVLDAFYLMPARFWELAAGCMAFLLHAGHVLRERPSWSRLRWAGSFAAVLALGAGLLSAEPQQTVATPAVVLATALLLLTLTGHGPLERILCHRLCVGLGMGSYSLYLWHWPLIVLARWSVGVSAGTLPLLLLAMALCTVFSYTVESFFRFPGNGQARWRGWLYRRPLQIYPAAVILTAAGLAMLQGGWKGLLFAGDRHRNGEGMMNMKAVEGTTVNSTNCFREPVAAIEQSQDSEACRIVVRPGAPTLYFEGDSHTLAILPIGRVVTASKERNFSILARGGCPVPYFRPWAGQRDQYPRYRLCPAHAEVRERQLLRQLRTGDAVVLTSYFDGYFIADDWSTLQGPPRRAALADLGGQLERLAGLLRQRGARLILFAPLPTFKDRPSVPIPLMACQQEWFRPNAALPPVCHPAFIDRRDLLRSFADIEDLFARIAERHPNVFVFHPLESLCPASEQRCSTHRGASMLYSDSNHLTNWGVSLLEAPFEEFLQRIERQQRAGGAGAAPQAGAAMAS